MPAECCVIETTIETRDESREAFEVVPEWGSACERRCDGGDVLATFAGEQLAINYVDEHNAAALASWSRCNWITLPRPVEHIEFRGCEAGKYPTSRIARISASVGTELIEVVGFGRSRHVADSHSHGALADAVEKLIAALAKPPAPMTEGEE